MSGTLTFYRKCLMLHFIVLDKFHYSIQGARILIWHGREISRPSLNPELIFRITGEHTIRTAGFIPAGGLESRFKETQCEFWQLSRLFARQLFLL